MFTEIYVKYLESFGRKNFKYKFKYHHCHPKQPAVFNDNHLIPTEHFLKGSENEERNKLDVFFLNMIIVLYT